MSADGCAWCWGVGGRRHASWCPSLCEDRPAESDLVPTRHRSPCPICGLPYADHTESCEALWEEER